MGQISIKAIFLFLLLGLAGLLQAQTHGGMGGKHGFKGNHAEWKEMAANIENLRLLKMLEAVDLSEDQSAKFVPLFHTFRRDLKSLREERDEIINNLQQLLHNGAEDNLIRQELDKIKDNQKRFNARMTVFFEDCEEILTVPQLARLTIFHERFERDMLKSVREFRRHHGPEMEINEP
jgi:Spy/CpxP family protein refolding chaperone